MLSLIVKKTMQKHKLTGVVVTVLMMMTLIM